MGVEDEEASAIEERSASKSIRGNHRLIKFRGIHILNLKVTMVTIVSALLGTRNTLNRSKDSYKWTCKD